MSNVSGQAGPIAALPPLRPDRVLLWCGLVLGGSLVFLTPPFATPDEFQHFERAYQISEGGWYPQKKAPYWAANSRPR